MDDDIEELGDLRLKLVLFNGTGYARFESDPASCRMNVLRGKGDFSLRKSVVAAETSIRSSFQPSIPTLRAHGARYERMIAAKSHLFTCRHDPSAERMLVRQTHFRTSGRWTLTQE